VVSSSYLEGEPLESSWHLRHHPYVQCAQNMERCRDWIITVRLGCLNCFVILLTSSLQTNWCHLIPSSVLSFSSTTDQQHKSCVHSPRFIYIVVIIITSHSLHQSFGSLATACLGLLGFLKAILCKKTQQKQTTQRQNSLS